MATTPEAGKPRQSLNLGLKKINRMHHAYSWNQKLYKQGIEQTYSEKD